MQISEIFAAPIYRDRVAVGDDCRRSDDAGQPVVLDADGFGGNRQTTTIEPGGEFPGYRKLLVERIQHLLGPELSSESAAISKHVLPGLFDLFDRILGASARAKFDAAANRLSDLRDDTAADRRILLCDILMEIVTAFDPLERQLCQFMGIVNDSEGTDPKDTHSPFTPGLSETNLRLLLRTLSLDLRFAIVDDAGRAALEVRHDAEKVRAVERVLDALWRPVLDKRQRFSSG